MPQLDQLAEQLDRLAAFAPGPFPVVSLYLNLQADSRGKDTVGPFLKKELVERLRTYGADAPERDSLENDRRTVVEYVGGRSPSANGLVVFASSGAGLFEAIQLSAPIDDHKLFAATGRISIRSQNCWISIHAVSYCWPTRTAPASS